MFAAITLGGLGNPFGALVGSFVIGMFVELWTWVFPSVIELKTIGALVALIVILLIRPQGILGEQGADRMNWALIFSNALYTAVSANAIGLLPDRHRAQRALRLHRAAQLRPGRLRRRRRLRRRHPGRQLRLVDLVLALPIVFVAGVVLRPAARHPDAAPARRLPRHRHHRRGRDHPPVRSTRCASRGSPAATTACRSSPADIESRQPVRHRQRVSPSWSPDRSTATDLFMHASSAGRSWRSCSLFVYLLMRSPWGRVLKSIREDEDAARSLGKNVLRLQDAEPDHRRRHRRLRRLWSSPSATAVGAARRLTPRRSRSSPTRSSILGGVGKVKGPIIGAIIFLFVITFVDNVLAQAHAAPTRCPTWLVDRQQLRPGEVHRRRRSRLALLVIFRPQGIFGDKREQAFDVR